MATNHNDAACDAEVRSAMMGGENNGSNGTPAASSSTGLVTPVLPATTGSVGMIATPGGSAAAAGTKTRKNTSFKITNVLPSRPPSNDQEDSGEEDESGNDGRGRKNGIADPQVRWCGYKKSKYSVTDPSVLVRDVNE